MDTERKIIDVNERDGIFFGRLQPLGAESV